MLCHGTLAQSGEEGFVRELDWHWYDAVLAAADRGAMLVEGAIHRQLTIPGRCEQASGPSGRYAPLVPVEVLSLFGLDPSDPRRPSTLSRLSFAARLFAAVGAQRRSEAEFARHLLRVWLETDASSVKRSRRVRVQSQN